MNEIYYNLNELYFETKNTDKLSVFNNNLFNPSFLTISNDV